jgi:pSer/pThr/pTyr-binding forkhead associated (FHA) protein
MAKLIVTGEGGGQVTHELAEELITIGRATDNLILIDDPSVSSRHATMHPVGDSYRLQDMESTNGTRVNGETISEVILRVGDRVRFGKVEACFECDIPGSAQPLPVLEEVRAQPAVVSARPVDFANASPFPRRSRAKDPVRTALFAAVGAAILVFLGSMLALLQMRPPSP